MIKRFGLLGFLILPALAVSLIFGLHILRKAEENRKTITTFSSDEEDLVSRVVREVLSPSLA